MKEFSNKDKQEHGKNAKIALEAILQECKNYSYIKELIKEYKCGYPEYDNKQFFCNFVIVFQDDTKWIVNITASFRSDRFKENQWDSYNIKVIDPSISKSILVYEDSLSDDEKNKFISYKYKIINKIHFSAVDNIVSQSELFELIENYANKNLSLGIKKDKQGNNFETSLANILSDEMNIKKWKTDDPKLVGMRYDYFIKIIHFLDIEKEEILSMKATSDKKIIGNLLTSGKPKTDVILKVLTVNNEVRYYTISCKKTNAKTVSVHQYNADAFIDALDPANLKLNELLHGFQKYGNMRDFGTENCEALEKELRPYIEKLTRWVIGGDGGKISNPLQIAKYIVISDGNDIFIHSVEDYVKMLLSPDMVNNFGTPFQWTFASHRKGIDIQLKCKILK